LRAAAGQRPRRHDLSASSGLNQAQIHRYEKGLAEPSMSALKGLALALGVTIDELVFEENERGPDEEQRLRFDAMAHGTEDKKAAKDLLDALILKHQASRWTGAG
jgi:transcriptional regulator with XRE-family HTH domain